MLLQMFTFWDFGTKKGEKQALLLYLKLKLKDVYYSPLKIPSFDFHLAHVPTHKMNSLRAVNLLTEA